MSKKLMFSWVKTEEVNSMEEITETKMTNQRKELDNMLIELKEKLNSELIGVSIINHFNTNKSGEYVNKKINTRKFYISNEVTITIGKKGRKSTWNDVYKLISTIKPSRYQLM